MTAPDAPQGENPDAAEEPAIPVPAHEDASGAASRELVSGKKKPPRPNIQNLEQFLVHAYALKGRKIALKPDVKLRMRSLPDLDQAAAQRLLEIAAKDVVLAVPRQILLASREAEDESLLRGAMREYARNAMLTHPIFARPELRAAVNNLPDAPTMPQALEMLAGTRMADLGALAEARFKKAKLKQLAINATNCMALWFAETRGLTTAALVTLLQGALWSRHSKKLARDVARFRALTEIRDVGGVGLACGTLATQADECQRQAVDSRGLANQARAALADLKDDLDRRRAEVQDLEAQIGVLEQDLDRGRAEGRTKEAHLRDDLEVRRTRVLRRLKGDVALLEEGLVALRRQPPKIEIMDDHAERVADSLRQELGKLESEG